MGQGQGDTVVCDAALRVVRKRVLNSATTGSERGGEEGVRKKKQKNEEEEAENDKPERTNKS